jgi:hypothetical protein
MCPSKYQPPNSQKGAETDISTLLSADILALLLHPRFGYTMLWNFSEVHPSKFLLPHNKLGLLSKFTEIEFGAAVGENSSTQALVFQKSNSLVERAFPMSVV